MTEHELSKRLRIKAAMIEMGERIAWGSDSSIMREASEFIDREHSARRCAQEQNDELKSECIKLTSKLSNAMGTRKVLWNLLGEALPLLCQIDCNDGESEERLNHLIQRIEDARSVVQAEELPCRTESQP